MHTHVIYKVKRRPKKKKPTFHISMKTLFRILNSFLLMTYLQYLLYLFHWKHLLWFSPFLPKWLVISLSFHICRFSFRWSMLMVAANGLLMLESTFDIMKLQCLGNREEHKVRFPFNYVYWEWIWQMWSKEKKQKWGG